MNKRYSDCFNQTGRMYAICRTVVTNNVDRSDAVVYAALDQGLHCLYETEDKIILNRG